MLFLPRLKLNEGLTIRALVKKVIMREKNVFAEGYLGTRKYTKYK
jgi:hypothetical protein